MRITKSVEVDFACYLGDAKQTLDIVRLDSVGPVTGAPQLTDRGPGRHKNNEWDYKALCLCLCICLPL